MKTAYEIVKNWRKNNPILHAKQKRRYALKTKYGLTELQYNEMLVEQDGKCKICRKISSRALDVDHCHETKEIRGLLCNQCNQAIGLMKHDTLIVKSAYEYLNGGVS